VVVRREARAGDRGGDAKLRDETYLLSKRSTDPNDDHDIFNKAFWTQFDNLNGKNRVTIADVLADPVKHTKFLKKGNVIVDGDLGGAGKMFHPDGESITNADHHQVVFKWDTNRIPCMLTSYPTP
jgi:hypothetical protein